MYNTERSETTYVIYDDVMTRIEDRGERVEMMVDIYDSVDTVRHHDLRTHAEKQQPHQHTGSVSVKNRKHKAAEVCLCLLCFLLLTAVIVLCVCFTTKRNQLLTHISNLTEEREQILSKYEQILNHNNNLTEESKQILKKCEQTLNHNNKLTEEREQIKNKINELQSGLYEQDQRADNFKWIYYNFSFYYISSEWKSWSYSRQDCLQRGADLVIINSQKEQEFLQKTADSYSFWIGLKKTEGVWKWADSTTMANGYWSSQFTDYNSKNCGLMTSTGWTNENCYSIKRWICKRRILKSHII